MVERDWSALHDALRRALEQRTRLKQPRVPSAATRADEALLAWMGGEETPDETALATACLCLHPALPFFCHPEWLGPLTRPTLAATLRYTLDGELSALRMGLHANGAALDEARLRRFPLARLEGFLRELDTLEVFVRTNGLTNPFFMRFGCNGALEAKTADDDEAWATDWRERLGLARGFFMEAIARDASLPSAVRMHAAANWLTFCQQAFDKAWDGWRQGQHTRLDRLTQRLTDAKGGVRLGISLALLGLLGLVALATGGWAALPGLCLALPNAFFCALHVSERKRLLRETVTARAHLAALEKALEAKEAAFAFALENHYGALCVDEAIAPPPFRHEGDALFALESETARLQARAEHFFQGLPARQRRAILK